MNHAIDIAGGGLLGFLLAIAFYAVKQRRLDIATERWAKILYTNPPWKTETTVTSMSTRADGKQETQA